MREFAVSLSSNEGNLGFRVAVTQVLASIGLGALLLTIDLTVAISGLTGGFIAALAAAVFLRRVFSPYRAQQPGRLLGRMYMAELTKFLLVGVLFGLFIKLYAAVNVFALFGVFFVVHIIPSFVAGYSGIIKE